MAGSVNKVILIGNLGQANYAAAKLGITALSKSIALDMARYNVRSNCLSPWAWSRMTSSIPTNTPEQQAAELMRRGCRHVLLKGGHGPQQEDVINRWFGPDGAFQSWRWR